MANLMDYLSWRGDLAIRSDGLNEVDGLIFAKLCFLDFSGIVPPQGEKSSVTLQDAAEAYFRRQDSGGPELGLVVPHAIPALLRAAAASARFRGVRLNAFEVCTDEEREEQFGALCFELDDGTVFCAFRGTDDSLVGWKEDLNLSFLDTIPSQRHALSYLTRIARQYFLRRIRVGGHSKGGNLAVYSAVYADKSIQRRITDVFNYDGPGFRESLVDTEEHRRIGARIRTYMPQSSVVGMMLQQEKEAFVVKSTASGIAQHNGFSWEVLGSSFVHLDDFSREGRRVEETLDSWAESLSLAQRKAFADALYEVLTSTGARTLSDLNEERLKNAMGMLKTYRGLEKETQQALVGAMGLLLKYNVRSIRQEMRASQEGLWKRLEDAWQRLTQPQ